MIASSIIRYPVQLKSSTSKVYRGKHLNNVGIPSIEYYLHEQQREKNVKRKMDEAVKYELITVKRRGRQAK